MTPVRCAWAGSDELMIKYHDDEWGKPIHDDCKLFEFLILEGFQAGLSWRTVLHKRERFRTVFENFEAEKIIRFNEQKVETLMQDTGIIRNRSKIKATISNAGHFLKVQKEFGTFDAFIWRFTDGKTIRNQFEDAAQIPVSSPESDAMSSDLKKRGFKFVGSTICYAYMQAVGMVDDHLAGCFKYGDYPD